jgi:subfamily B ATP-binding cassette protein MsbA
MKEFGKAVKYLIPYKKYVIFNVLCNLLNVFFQIFSLTMIAPFVAVLFGIVEPVLTKPTFSFNINNLLQWCYYEITILKNEYSVVIALLFIAGLFVFFTFCSVLLRYLAARFLIPVRNGIVKDMRTDIYKKFLILPLSFFTEQHKGDLIARISNDCSEVDISVVKFLQSVVKDPLLIIVFISTLVMISPKLLLLIAIIFPIIWLIISFIGKKLKRNSDILQKEYGRILNVAEESLSGIRVIKSYNAQKKTISNFEETQSSFTVMQTKIQRRIALSTPLTEILVALAAVSLIWYGGAMVISKEIPVESFVLFIVVFFRLLSPSKDFANAFFFLQRGRAALQRIFSVTEKQDNQSNNATKVLLHFNDKISFQNLDFAYQNEVQVIKNLNLEIKKGEKIAIVGSSGSGKTTLIDLLLRHYQPQKGKILIDDININEIEDKSFHKIFALVSQHSFLFNDNIFNNLTMGIDKTEEEVVFALKQANAYNFVMEMGGIYANLSDSGNNLSGGQKQRLNIARAILREPEILILDEATSALDVNTETEVQTAVENLMRGKTCIIIAHRESSIKNADRVFEI